MAWQKVTVDGDEFDFYKQEFAVECGPSCVAMVSKIAGKGMSLTDARKAIRGNEFTSVGLYNTNWQQDATSSMKSLSQALASRKVGNAKHWKSKKWDEAWWIRKVTEDTTKLWPSIVRVYDPYGHFVVCLGKGNGGDIELLDPEYGHITVPIGNCRYYDRPDITQTNWIDQWVVVTTK